MFVSCCPVSRQGPWKIALMNLYIYIYIYTDSIDLQEVWCLSACKNQLHSSLLSWDVTFKVTKIRHPWLWPPKRMVSACRKLWCLSTSKKINFIPPPSWDIPKCCNFVILGYFGHAWPRPPKPKLLACKKLCRIYTYKKST